MSDVQEELLNQLMRLDPTSFIYAAQPPCCNNSSSSSRRRKRAGGALLRGADAGDVDDGSTVFGSYAAVSLCDCRSGCGHNP